MDGLIIAVSKRDIAKIMYAANSEVTACTLNA